MTEITETPRRTNVRNSRKELLGCITSPEERSRVETLLTRHEEKIRQQNEYDLVTSTKKKPPRSAKKGVSLLNAFDEEIEEHGPGPIETLGRNIKSDMQDLEKRMLAGMKNVMEETFANHNNDAKELKEMKDINEALRIELEKYRDIANDVRAIVEEFNVMGLGGN
jgi:hypothetical protein